jgi:hypothetical protein
MSDMLRLTLAVGFEYALTQIRFVAGYGAVHGPHLLSDTPILINLIKEISTNQFRSPKLSRMPQKSRTSLLPCYLALGMHP